MTPAAFSGPAPLNLPPIAEETLPNGFAVISARRGDLPLVAVRLVLPTGSARDPAGKEGLASFTAQLLRRGTESRSAEQVDDAVESIGGLMGVEVGPQATSLQLTVPSEQVERAVEILADLARRASFPDEEVERSLRRELAQLRGDLDDPSTVADRALTRFFYGAAHPYGHPTEGSTASVRTFARADLQAFRDTTYTPFGAFLVMVGDIEPEQAFALAQRFMGDWTGTALEPLTVSWPATPEGTEILLVDKADATQAQIRVAVPGIRRRDPAYHAAVVANAVVGGGFTSRLVDEVRVNRGLSYSVGTRVVAMRDIGAISYSTFTRTDTVREILDVSLEVLGTFVSEGPTEDELGKARRYIAGLYPARVESVDGFAEALASAKLMGLPFASIASYRDDIARVDREAAAGAAKSWPTARRAKIVIVGNAEAIRPQVESLGRIEIGRVSDYE